MKQLTNRLQNESGVTLVELLAALAILSIIVISFLGFFVQAGKTNNMTTENNEATFLAQEEMERVTSLSSKGVKAIEVPKPVDKNGFSITTTISPDTEYDLYKVLVKVEGGNKGRAKMETRLPFAEETTPEE